MADYSSVLDFVKTSIICDQVLNHEVSIISIKKKLLGEHQEDYSKTNGPFL